MSEAAITASQERKRLKEQVEDWRSTPENLLSYLAWSNRFHSYSPLNRAMILAQRPDATWCASYKDWAALGRKPRGKGTGIQVFYPRIIKDEVERDGKIVQENRVIGYGKTHTFDIADTVPLDESDTRTIEEVLQDLNAPIGNSEQLMAFIYGLDRGFNPGYSLVKFSETAAVVPVSTQTTTVLELVGHLAYIDALANGENPDEVFVGATREINFDPIPTVRLGRSNSAYIPPFRILGAAWAIADRLGVDATKTLGLHQSRAVLLEDNETMSDALRFIDDAVSFIDLVAEGTPVEWAAAMLQAQGILATPDSK